ncbi:hypothetical protein PC110_g13599 [Phytophthora cactorum]|uniref:HTH CENPB-type domain-containing protein n=1 Tax=Phytophthora cactorum TaxID=29920 RepID=A0A329S390_9STRA|nr:hypothetical protein PC110_g22492 [Phytophthora cactorum]RAW30038.1 hypothetical protein PC110_g13599 [Phytophthora cactorum]
MVVRLGCYKKEDLEEALDRAYEGEKFSAVARTSSTPLRTLFKKSKELQTTGNIVERRRGSLHSFYQSRKLIWCRTGMPFQPLTKGWYGRFISRHPLLMPRAAEKIARVRNMVDTDSVRTLFYAITKRVVELQLSGDRVFNMDETSFMHKGTSSRVLALKGSSNVWSKETRPNFHMTVVAAVNAAGAALPSLIIVPGKRIYKTDRAALSVENARVTGAPKGFSNEGVFRLRLAMFAAEAAKINAHFSVVLVLENSSTHHELGT